MNIEIRAEATADREAIDTINRAAFGGEDEVKLVDALRQGGFVEISLVALVDGEIVGHILLSRVAIHAKAGMVEALSLAPMAVAPSHQRQGIGTKLIEAGLDACRERGHQIVTVLGHPAFYRRFGFSPDLARPLESPFGGGEAWMALELAPGSLASIEGRVEYAPPFRAFE